MKYPLDIRIRSPAAFLAARIPLPDLRFGIISGFPRSENMIPDLLFGIFGVIEDDYVDVACLFLAFPSRRIRKRPHRKLEGFSSEKLAPLESQALTFASVSAKR